MADAVIKLETGIQQTSEEIKLWAKKEIESTEGEIYQKYDAELSIQADEISQRVTKEEYEAGTGELEAKWEGKLSVLSDNINLRVTYEDFNTKTNEIETSLESSINVEAGRITTLSREVDNINNTISEAGWITSSEGNVLWASKRMEDGSEIISEINQTSTSIKIQAAHINLTGAVSFSMFSSSLQSDFNSKLESGDMGDLAFKDYVSSGDLSSSLSSTISNKASLSDVTNALRDYITDSDLDRELSSVLSSYVSSSYLSQQLSNYATQTYASNQATSEFERLRKAIINGTTSVLGGMISTNLIDADAIFANLAQIGGFHIESNGIVNYNNTSSIRFGNMSDTNCTILGTSAIPATSGMSANVYLRNKERNFSSTAMIIDLTIAQYTSGITPGPFWIWGVGPSGSSCKIGTSNYGESFDRAAVNFGKLPTKTMVQKLSGMSGCKFGTLLLAYKDDHHNTYLCFE